MKLLVLLIRVWFLIYSCFEFTVGFSSAIITVSAICRSIALLDDIQFQQLLDMVVVYRNMIVKNEFLVQFYFVGVRFSMLRGVSLM